MKKKVLIGSIIPIVLIILALIFYWFYNAQNIRSKVLSQLEQNFEFCSILSDNINSFSSTGEFWMICNDRPFYATYKNGNVSYELNGWGFLRKDPNLWNELNNCNFYNSEKAMNGYKLLFYCKGLNGISVKIYSFDTNLVKMEKIEERSFLDIFAKDVRSLYNFLTECKVVNFSQVLPNIWLNFDCEGLIYSVIYSEKGVLPVLVSDSSYEEMARVSFEKSTGLKATKVSYLEDKNHSRIAVYITSTSESNESINVEYVFGDLPQAFAHIECSEDQINNCIRKFIKYLLFPPIKVGEIELIGKRELGEPDEFQQNIFLYKINQKVVLLNTNKAYGKMRIMDVQVKDEGWA
jgi:hypothetical protein